MGVISLAPYSSKTLPIFCSSQSDNSGFVDSKSLLSSVEKSNRALFCSTKTKYVRKRISYRISAAAETETLNGSTSHEDFQFDSIEQAIQDIRDGKAVIVVDDAERENEGDLIFAASLSTTSTLASVLPVTSGLLCCGAKPEWLERLGLPLLVPPKSNSDALRTAFTVPIDYMGPPNSPSSSPTNPQDSHLVSPLSPQSAEGRALTLRSLCEENVKPSYFRRPGHIFPLQAKKGGVLQRAGHTEAAVDLAELAGLPPLGALCEVVLESGKMARLPDLSRLAKERQLSLVSIEQLVRFRLEREWVVEKVPNLEDERWEVFSGKEGFRVQGFRSLLEDGVVHLALSAGNGSAEASGPVYVHRECLKGHIFGAKSCACRENLEDSLRAVSEEGSGVVLFLRQKVDENGTFLGCSDAEKINDIPLEGGSATMEAKSIAIIGQILFLLGSEPKVLSGVSFSLQSLSNYSSKFADNSDLAKVNSQQVGFPHYDFNVSHHGDFVVLASESLCSIGVDVMTHDPKRIEPLKLFLSSFDDYFTENEWKVIWSTSPERSKVLDQFYRHWCLKESFLKAIGIGLGFELKRLEFQYADKANIWCKEAKLSVDGRQQSNWKFSVERLGLDHWIAIALGPVMNHLNEDVEKCLQRSPMKELRGMLNQDFVHLQIEDLVPKQVL